ncbi:peptidylprolyl isomerase [Novosphingobium sp. FSY-8]|uniref:peptidylprolyl isomerase n=2 Tax=Novosphingobium ovatum TaxID=1908523 RepID=A0ABW9XDA8_9SPHN|nr:peptidylprolyl isomerase [Novosphingobium ovatum]
MRFAVSAALMGAMMSMPAMAAPARKAAPVAAKPAPVPDVARVAITTPMGVITLELDGKHAPISVGNFLRYVDARRFDGMVFFRSMHLPWGDPPNGLIQGGIRDAAKLFPPIAHEPTSQTGILHKAGTISLARHQPGSATADFFILLSELSSLDADPKATDPDAQAGFAAFGHVAEGMDVVRKIWEQDRSPTAGEGAMKGQMLATPVKMLTVRRVPMPAAVSAPAATPVAPAAGQ